MQISVGEFDIHLVDEPSYTQGSSDNIRSYQREYPTTSKYTSSSNVGVFLGAPDNPVSSTVLLGQGGGTALHCNSWAHNNNLLFICTGDAVFALKIPTLEICWHQQVDFAACFGVYWLESKQCLLTWGEIEIRRLTLQGDTVWIATGKDIFSEGFVIKPQTVEVTDFNNEHYIICIDTGQIDLI